ncbi:cullin [Trypanosoma rangeli]|uniref:Cullin n=1 Tax=Trypanosoma rangeli TaxID=5698 RepID=A0A422N6U7_TRYRA|nr:cullin [Trypanosoma rangeli]RNF01193.1 cullin [Trypanosoma rangeli]|eukprot:RNF01193.1 cullin [Trypanosoma rangeli]
MSLSFAQTSISGNREDSDGDCSNDKRVDCSRIHESDAFSWLQDRSSVDDLWPGVESYLVQAAHTIRTGSAEMMDRLRDVKHRMNWYAAIYSVCSGHPQKSGEVYQHLSLFLLNDLEVNVLRPFLLRGAACGSSSLSCLCQQFVQQYRLFMAFRRVVLSCFSYLDQYFTVKFRLDPVTALCAKMFYVVVYEPIKEVLVSELLELADAARTAQLHGSAVSSEASDVQQTLWAIVEILTTVKAFSTSSEATAQTARPHHKEDASGLCNDVHNGGEGSTVFAAVTAELERRQGLTTTPRCDVLRKRSESPEPRLGISSNSDHDQMQRRVVSEGHGGGSSAKGWDAVATKSFNAIHMLREMLKKRLAVEVITSHLITNPSGKKGLQNSGNVLGSGGGGGGGAAAATTTGGVSGREGGATCSAYSVGVSIVDVVQPLHFVIFLDFGVQYVEAAEIHYRKQRMVQLSQPEGWIDYIPWVQRCLAVERVLLRDVNAPLFLSALQERINHVLLVEIHRQIILAKEVGFRAHLDAWDRHTKQGAANMLKDLTSSSSASTGVTVLGDAGDADADVARSPATCILAPSTNLWERFSQEELGNRIKGFVTAFLSVQDEACWTLLASEFASKVFMDTAALFLAYMSQLGALTQQQQHHQEEEAPPRLRRPASWLQTSQWTTALPLRQRGLAEAGEIVPSEVKPVTQQSLAMGLISDLVDVSMHYSDLICTKFGEHPPMQLAMADALREVLNPERWSKLVVGGVMRGGVSALSRGELPSFLLYHDVAKTTLGVLNKLTAMRGTKEIAVPQFLAMYCDQLCRRELDDVVTDPTDHIVYLIALLDDKDVFFEHYKSLLARRLLLLPWAKLNMDREHALMHKLHHALGRALTYRLEAMLRDYEANTSMNEEFGRFNVCFALPAKLRVQVLTAVHWPTYRVVSLTPCDSLARVMKAFTDYYIGLHPSRMLHWIHTLGSATLHAVFPKGSKEVIANTLQAHILLLVSDACNAGGSIAAVGPETNADQTTAKRPRLLSGREISAAMGVELRDIYIYLAPLVQHKLYNLLKRVGPSAEAGAGPTAPPSPPSLLPFTEDVAPAAVTAAGRLLPEDKFTLNVDYTHRLRKFKLPVARPTRGDGSKGSTFDPTYAERRETALSGGVEVSRRLQTDTAIVRVMKSRRALRYYELLDLTIQQLAKYFVPRARSVKMQVEDLVCRGFLRRSEVDASVFEYIA